MSILKLPSELLMSIAESLESRDLNALLRCHSYLYKALNDYLYRLNVQHDAPALYWAASSGSDNTLQRLLDAGANVLWDSPYFACSVQKPATRLRELIWEENMKEHPISYAAAQGHLNIVEHLLDLGVDINYRDADGLNPSCPSSTRRSFCSSSRTPRSRRKTTIKRQNGSISTRSGGLKGLS
jgi:hypothetical protein